MTQAADIAAGLSARGYEVSRAGSSGWRATSTAICHGGDRADGLQWRDDGRGGVMAKCFTRGCTHAEAAKALREAAGVSSGRKPRFAARRPAPRPAPVRTAASPSLTGATLAALLKSARFAPTLAQVAAKSGVSPAAVQKAARAIGAAIGMDGKLTLGATPAAEPPHTDGWDDPPPVVSPVKVDWQCSACAETGAPCADCVEEGLDAVAAWRRERKPTLAHTPLTPARIKALGEFPPSPDWTGGISVCDSCKKSVPTNRLAGHKMGRYCSGFVLSAAKLRQIDVETAA